MLEVVRVGEMEEVEQAVAVVVPLLLTVPVEVRELDTEWVGLEVGVVEVEREVEGDTVREEVGELVNDPVEVKHMVDVVDTQALGVEVREPVSVTVEVMVAEGVRVRVGEALGQGHTVAVRDTVLEAVELLHKEADEVEQADKEGVPEEVCEEEWEAVEDWVLHPEAVVVELRERVGEGVKEAALLPLREAEGERVGVALLEEHLEAEAHPEEVIEAEGEGVWEALLVAVGHTLCEVDLV